MPYEMHNGSKIGAIRYAQMLADAVGLELMVITRPCKTEGKFRYYIEHRCNPLEQTVDKVIYRTRGPGLFPAVVSTDAAQKEREKYS